MVTLGHGKINASPNAGSSGEAAPKDEVPFPACIACGFIQRSLVRVEERVPEACRRYFDRHCWNATVAESPRSLVYDPALILEPNVH